MLNRGRARPTVHYSKAPISEAVIDLRADFLTQPTIEVLEAIASRIGDGLPLRQRVNSFAFNLAATESSPELVGSTASSVLGVRLSSSENDRVLQLLRHGLAYSHLPPYSDWGTFTDGLKPLWDGFVAGCHVQSVNRIAVRYINRIPVPNGADVDDYLALGARIPDAVTKHIIGYFVQIVLPIPELGPQYRAVINTGVEPGVASNPAGLLLDIDVFCEGSFAVAGDEIWAVLERLHSKKNEIFEASITDRVREIIR